MDFEPKDVALGATLALCVITLSWNVFWRHYTTFVVLAFPQSTNTSLVTAARLFFAFCFVGSIWNFIDVLVDVKFRWPAVGFSFLFAVGVVVIFYALDAVVTFFFGPRNRS